MAVPSRQPQAESQRRCTTAAQIRFSRMMARARRAMCSARATPPMPGASRTASLVRLREIGAVGRRDRYRSRGEPRHVVDAVADHRDVYAALAQFDHVREFRFGCRARGERQMPPSRRLTSRVGSKPSPLTIFAADTETSSAASVAGTSSRSAMRTPNSATTVGAPWSDRCEIERRQIAGSTGRPLQRRRTRHCRADSRRHRRCLRCLCPVRCAPTCTSCGVAARMLSACAKGCAERDSSASRDRRWLECARAPRSVTTVTSSALPPVNVPVLSNTTWQCRARRSMTCARVMTKPNRRSAIAAAVIAIGVANDSAQGHDTTSTAMAVGSARAGSTNCHARNDAAAIARMAATKRCATQSASNATGGLSRVARCARRWISATRVCAGRVSQRL